MKTRLKSHADGSFTVEYKEFFFWFWMTYQEEIVVPWPFYNFFRKYRTASLVDAITTMLNLEDKL